VIASPSFLLLSIIRTIRAGKWTAVLLILGFAAGWLLPAAVLSAARHEQIALLDGMMPDARRIIRLEERPFPAEPSNRLSGEALSALLRDLDPAIESVSRRSMHAGIIHDGRVWRYVRIQSVDPSYIGLFRRFIRRGDASAHGLTCIAGVKFAADVWGGSGIGRDIKVGTGRCAVTGETIVHDSHLIVVEEEGTFRGWTQLFVKVKESGDTDEVLAKIRQTAGEHWIVERMDVVERRERAQMADVYAFVFLLSLAALLYALLNIGNVMGLLARGRRKAHGIALAIGASPRMIRAEAAGELLALSTVPLLAVFAALKAGQPIVGRYLFAIQPDAAVMLTAFALHLPVCGTAALILTRRYRKPDIMRLIREAD
jgi:hypothetical protein